MEREGDNQPCRRRPGRPDWRSCSSRTGRRGGGSRRARTSPAIEQGLLDLLRPWTDELYSSITSCVSCTLLIVHVLLPPPPPEPSILVVNRLSIMATSCLLQATPSPRPNPPSSVLLHHSSDFLYLPSSPPSYLLISLTFSPTEEACEQNTYPEELHALVEVHALSLLENLRAGNPVGSILSLAIRSPQSYPRFPFLVRQPPSPLSMIIPPPQIQQTGSPSCQQARWPPCSRR